MPQLIITSSDIDHDTIIAGDQLYRHLRSLRVRPRELVTLLDEQHTRYTARLEGFRGQSAVLKILSRSPVMDGHSGILLAQAVIRNENMHTALQKATELGVDALVPFISRYTSIKINSDHFLTRSRKIIREAVGQSMRGRIPELFNPVTYTELILSMPGIDKIVFHNSMDTPDLHDVAELVRRTERIMLVIGPEGGFSEDEILYARQHNAVIARLGDTILRAETAAIAAISIVSFLRTGERHPRLR